MVKREKELLPLAPCLARHGEDVETDDTQKNFRRLDAPHLLAEGAEEAIYFNGVRVRKTEQQEEAA